MSPTGPVQRYQTKNCHPGSERSELSGIFFYARAKEIPDDSASRASGMTREWESDAS